MKVKTVEIKSLPSTNKLDGDEYLLVLKKGKTRQTRIVVKRKNRLVFWDAEDSRAKGSFLLDGRDVDFKHLTNLFQIRYES